MNSRVEVQWCTLCGKRFIEEEVAGAMSCPACGSTGIPCAVSDDVMVAVNWHELRILGIWAENWAKRCDDAGEKPMMPTVHAITRRIQRQFFNKTPLTLSGEIAELPAKIDGIGGIETHGIAKPTLVPVNGPGASDMLPRPAPPTKSPDDVFQMGQQ